LVRYPTDPCEGTEGRKKEKGEGRRPDPPVQIVDRRVMMARVFDRLRKKKKREEGGGRRRNENGAKGADTVLTYRKLPLYPAR